MNRTNILPSVRRSLLAMSLVGIVASCAIFGCAKSDSAGSGQSSASSPKVASADVPESESTPATGPGLSESQSAALEAIRVAGGQVARGAGGLPELIDLASERVYADDGLVRAVLEFPALRRLRLAVSTASPETLAGLKTLVNLNELMLQDAAITDDELTDILGAMPKLKRLVLRRLSRVTDDGIRPIAALPRLEVLSLIELDQITGAALDQLRAAKRLRSLDLRNCGNLKPADFVKLTSFAGLSELKIGGPVIDDAVLKIVIQLPAISALTIEDAGISGDGLRQLAASAELAGRLRSLSLARCFGITDDALQVLGEFPVLDAVALRDLSLTGSFLKTLDQPSKTLPWTTLVVTNAFLTDEVVVLLPSLAPGLKRLDLRGNLGVTNKSVEVLDKMPALEETHLEGTGVTAD